MKVKQSEIQSQKDQDALRTAEEYGIDLSILVENLRLTPTERLEKLRARLQFSEEIARSRKMRDRNSGV